MTEKYRETRIRLRPDVDLALNYYIMEKNTHVSKEIPGMHLDRNSVVSDVMEYFLTEAGHYPPRSDKK